MIKHLRLSLAAGTRSHPIWGLVGRQLRARRTQLGLDVDRVAEELAISPATYEAYESGGRQVPAFQIGQIAELFGVQVAWFFRDVSFDAENDDEVPTCVDAPRVFCVATEEQRVRALADSFRRLDLEGQHHLLAIAGALSRSNREQAGD